MKRVVCPLLLLLLLQTLAGCTWGENDEKPPGLGINWVNNYSEPVYVDYQLPGGERDRNPGMVHPNEGSGTLFGDCIPGETWILLAIVDMDDRVLHEKTWTNLECGQYTYFIDAYGVGNLVHD